MRKKATPLVMLTAALAGTAAAAIGLTVINVPRRRERRGPKYIDINDNDLGVLSGRDCVYIDTVTLDHMDSLTFKGEINGLLASKIRDYKWIPYKLTFKRVISYSSCELDTFLNREYRGYMPFGHGCFTEVQNSRLLAKLPIRYDFDRSIYKHFRVFTYDVVFDIFAAGYELTADLANMKNFGSGSIGISVEDCDDQKPNGM